MKFLLYVCGILLVPSVLLAQESAPVRKIVLPLLDSQVRARLVALDARLNPVHTPTLAATFAGSLSMPGGAWSGLAPILADKRNNDIWEQMPEDYYRMMLESGDALVTVQDWAPPGGAWTSTQVRRLCQQRLGRLPAASLEQYRQGVNAEARAFLHRGQTQLDPAPLRRLAEELFCSRSGDRALDLLGDLAFERGDFEEAQHWWSLLVGREPNEATSPAATRESMRFPDPEIDLTRVRAKMLLGMLFQGRLNEARAGIHHFQKTHSLAQGELAGRKGLLHESLRATLTAFQKDRIANNDEPWTTFGGEPSRNRVLSQGLAWHLWEDGPAWRVRLPSLALPDRDHPPDRLTPLRNLAFHPVIVQDQVVICDHRSVHGYDLKTGKETLRYDLKAAGLRDPGPGLDEAIRQPRFTLSADRDRVFARLGAMKVGPRKNGEREEPSYLVCLALQDPGAGKSRELWHIASGEDGTFEGAPLVQDGLVYIARTRVVERRAVVSIWCYDVHGRQRWAREVCDAPEFEGHGGPRTRLHLLTRAAGQIVYASHAGAICAVDAWTGQPTWAVRYPSRGPLTAEFEPSPRDLAPCLAADGCIYAAPLDTDRLLCIDAVTGRVRWEAEETEIVHLLGVAEGRVLTATRTGLQAFDTQTGRAEWLQPSEGRLPSLGRGLLAGSWLYWPTQDSLLPTRAVTVHGGKLEAASPSVLPEPRFFDPTMFATMPAGNWAFGQGCLVIAGGSELVVYAPPRYVPKAPVDPRPQTRMDDLYRKARFLASAGDVPAADQAYRELAEATKGDRNARDWQALIEVRRARLADAEKVPAFANSGAMPAWRTPAAPEPALPRWPLARAWEHREDRVWPLDDDAFLGTRAGRVAYRDLATGDSRWERPLDLEPAWVGQGAGVIVVVGADGVRAFRRKDGTLAWSFAAPSRRWPTVSFQYRIPWVVHASTGIETAHFSDEGLLLLDDRRALYRLNLETGAVVWRYTSPSAALRPLDAGAFSPWLAPAGDRIFVQENNGQPAFFAEGKLTSFGRKSRPWEHPPVLTEKSVIFAGEEGQVHAHERGPRCARLWSYEAPYRTSLAGGLCRLQARGSVLLALVPRNQGYDWTRLDPQRGEAVWSLDARQLPEGIDPDSVAIGDTLFYYVAGQKVYANALNDGRQRWTQPLHSRAERWRLRYAGEGLAVTPVAPAREEDFEVALLDAFTGEWNQRLTFPGAHGPGSVVWSSRAVVVAAGGRIFGFRSLDAE